MRWLLTVVGLLIGILVAVALGAVPAHLAARRMPRDEAKMETDQHEPRPLSRTVLGTLIRLDRGSVWRSVPMRRGVMVLAVGPGLVAVFGDLPWSSMTILPGLVASGGALLFGVNAWSLDGRGALWRESLPVTPSNVFDARAWVITEFLAVASFITLGLGALRAGIPNGTESAALAVHPGRGAAPGGRGVDAVVTAAPLPGRHALGPRHPGAPGHHGRLLGPAGGEHDVHRPVLLGLLEGARLAALGDRRDPLRAVVGGAVRPDLPALGGPDAAGACGHHQQRPDRAARPRHYCRLMEFSPSPRAADLTARVADFMATEITPIEADYHRDLAEARRTGDPWQPLPVIEELKAKARAQGLWNLFLPAKHAGEYAARFGTDGGEGLTNVDYAPLAELMGRSAFAPLVFNCNAPDTGNMEVLLHYGSPAQREEWLEPLLDGRIRSAFTMTEPGVASSDATNMAATCVVDGDEVVVNGRKWWSTGVGHPECRIYVFMGVTDPEADRHHRHSMVLVPRDTRGVKIERLLPTMGIYDEPLGSRRGVLHRRPRPGGEHHLRSRRGLRDRPGPARAGPGAPLHAADRARRDGARAGLPARAGAHGVRQAAGRPRRQPRADRRRPDRHRPGPAAGAATPPGSSTSAAR